MWILLTVDCMLTVEYELFLLLKY